MLCEISRSVRDLLVTDGCVVCTTRCNESINVVYVVWMIGTKGGLVLSPLSMWSCLFISVDSSAFDMRLVRSAPLTSGDQDAP